MKKKPPNRRAASCYLKIARRMLTWDTAQDRQKIGRALAETPKDVYDKAGAIFVSGKGLSLTTDELALKYFFAYQMAMTGDL